LKSKHGHDGLQEVHRSNMSKLGRDDKPSIRNDGKVLKSERHSLPGIESVLQLQTAEMPAAVNGGYLPGF
jgi:hypothetical protein